MFTCSLQIRSEKFQSFSEKLTADVFEEQRSGYSRLWICSDRRRATQLHLRAHFLNLRRLFPYSGHESLNFLLLLRDCRLQFCHRLFLHFAGHESRGRAENPFEESRKRIATGGTDRRDFDQHIVGQAVAVCVGS